MTTHPHGSDRSCPYLIAFAGDVVVKPGFAFGPRTIPEYELVYFPSTSQTNYVVKDTMVKIVSPGFIITRPGEEHGYEFDPVHSTRHLFIHFVLQSYREKSGMPLLDNADFVVNYSLLIPSLLNKLMQMAHTTPLRWRERCNQILQVILEELNETYIDSEIRNEPIDIEYPPQLTTAIQYIDRHMQEGIKVIDLAELVGWTHAHFTRMMKEYSGLPPNLFIMKRRIERAANLLIYKNCSIKEIAYETGFADEPYFSRWLPRVKGLSATEFRRKFFDPRAHSLTHTGESEWGYPMNRWFYFDQ